MKNWYIVILSMSIGVLSGILFLVQPVARQLSYDPVEYCEDQGVYFADAGKSIEAVASMESTVTGFDYAYVCNINSLHIESLKKLKPAERYGVTRGNITDIPATIGSLPDLIRLQIHDQRITSLPEEIALLSNMEILKLGGNNITSLPTSIGNLSKLSVLHIYGNNLTSLPSSLGNLTQLKEIDARTNNIRSLPDSLANLKDTLEVLYLGGNPIPLGDHDRIRSMLPHTKIYF